MLQPLNIIVNQPFEAHMQCSCSEWVQKTYEMTFACSLERSKLKQMCWWLLEAWQFVLQGMIAKMFQVTGISKNVKGSEGDFLWHQSNKECCQDDTADSEED
jgi:hypothetical protein